MVTVVVAVSAGTPLSVTTTVSAYELLVSKSSTRRATAMLPLVLPMTNTSWPAGMEYVREQEVEKILEELGKVRKPKTKQNG